MGLSVTTSSARLAWYGWLVTLKAIVQNGRLVLDEPVEFADGEYELMVVRVELPPSVKVSESLRKELAEGVREAEAGETVGVDVLLGDLAAIEAEVAEDLKAQDAVDS